MFVIKITVDFRLKQLKIKYDRVPVSPAMVVVNGIIVIKVSMIPVLFVKCSVPRDAKITLKFSLKSTSLLPT